MKPGLPFLPSYFDLNANTFRMLSDFIRAYSGLRFDETSKIMLQRRLSPRIRELNLNSFENYYYHLNYHPNRDTELDTIFDLVTTNETYFFREERQLQAFSEELLPEILIEKKAIKSLRIWSAGCATGEEPYTIAILCSQIPELADWNVDIYGSDISQRAIQIARRAIYGESSFRNMPSHSRDRFFDKAEEKYKLKENFRKMVTFGKVNLMDPEKTGIFAELDVIFCRNVIIYFDLEAKKQVIETFYRKLRKKGYLLLGHSESLLTLSTKFKLVHLKHDMVYQK